MSGTDLIIRWGNLKQYFEDLDKVGGQAADVEKYARDEVFNRSGFAYDLCVLKPLADVMDTLGDTFGDLRTTFDGRWEALLASLALTADEISQADGVQGQAYLKAYLELTGDN